MITSLMRKVAVATTSKDDPKINRIGLGLMTGLGAGLGAVQGVADLDYAKNANAPKLDSARKLTEVYNSELERTNNSISATMRDRDTWKTLLNELQSIDADNTNLSEKLQNFGKSPNNNLNKVQELLQKMTDANAGSIGNRRETLQQLVTNADQELQALGKYHEMLTTEQAAATKQLSEATARAKYLESGGAKLRLIGKPAVIGGAIGAAIPVGVHLYKKYRSK